MVNQKIIIYIILTLICFWIIISEIKSFNKEYSKANEFTKSSIKINGRYALFYAIIGLIALFYLIYKNLND